MRKIILASASPRRSELMKQAGLDFDVCVSTKEEKKGPWDGQTAFKTKGAGCG